ncbi:MAG TPA: hypothetical protein VFO31_13590 [Vicinamibacterales bacterium]|nr:hypothetical protein [Vicinamibacterales bacterium]
MAKLVDERLTARLKDQKLVEMETAQAVVARIGEWTKLFGFFVAFPLGILVIVLTVLGFRQYSDLVRTVQSSKQDFLKQVGEIQSQLADAAHAGQSARAEGQKLNQEIAEIRKTLDLTQAAKIRGELEQLSARVTGIESRFKISSPGVSTALERSLTAALSRFADYMEAVGFNAKRAPATVTIESRGGGGVGLNSYYDPSGAKVVVGAEIANLETDPSMVLWPYAQHLMTLENKVVIPSNDGPGPALANAIPDYFVASHLNEPRLGRGFPGAPKGYLRNADNQRQFDPKVTEPHDVGEIWTGVLWTVRKTAGQRDADRLVYTFWKSLQQGDFADRTGGAAARRLVEAARATAEGKYVALVRDNLQARNLKF